MRFSILLLACLLHSNITIAQQEVQLMMQDVKEERHTDIDESFIEIEAKVLGLKIDEYNQIKMSEIISATDNTGQQLEMKESFFGNEFDDDETIKIRLEAPKRSATQIAKIEGIILQYSPSESNNSKVIVKNSAANVNTNILKGKSDEIALMLLDRSSLEDLEKTNEAEYQKKMDALREAGIINNELDEGIDQLKNFFDGFSSFGRSENMLTFHVKGDREKIIDIIVYDENGKQQAIGHSRINNVITRSCRTKPNENWTIEVLLENEAAMKKMKFTLTNVPLP